MTGLLLNRHRRNDWGRGRIAFRPGPLTLVKGAPVHHLATSPPRGNQ